MEWEGPPSGTWGQTHIWGYSICFFKGKGPETRQRIVPKVFERLAVMDVRARESLRMMDVRSQILVFLQGFEDLTKPFDHGRPPASPPPPPVLRGMSGQNFPLWAACSFLRLWGGGGCWDHKNKTKKNSQTNIFQGLSLDFLGLLLMCFYFTLKE